MTALVTIGVLTTANTQRSRTAKHPITRSGARTSSSRGVKRSECLQASAAYEKDQGWDDAEVAPSNIPTYPFGQYATISGSETSPPTAYGAARRGPWR